jgi:hypothetical protein
VFPHLPRELLTKVRMCDGNHRLISLGDRFSLEVEDSVFGHNVHHVGPRGRDDIPRREVRNDATLGFTTLVLSGRQADERLSAPGSVPGAHELKLPARSAEVAVPVAF